HVNMARELYEAEPAFRAELDRSAAIVRDAAGLDLIAAIYPAEPADDRAKAALDRPEICELALFAVEYALARLLISMGVAPHSFIGHSVGEYVAACLAGVFSLDDAICLVAARGRLVGAMPPGGMLAVSAPESRVKTWIDPATLSIALVNTPASTVVAGAP